VFVCVLCVCVCVCARARACVRACNRSVQAGIHILEVRTVKVEIGGADGAAVEYSYADLELARKVWEWCCQIFGLPASQLPLPPSSHVPFSETPTVTSGRGPVKSEPDGDTGTAGVTFVCVCVCVRARALEKGENKNGRE